jgi:tetratricopeptide (TPR) repeat protein
MSGVRQAGAFAGGAGAASTDILAESLALLRARQPGRALALLEGLPAARQGEPAVAARLAYAKALLGRFGEAIAAARAALAGADDVETLDLAGNSLVLCQRPSEAYPAFRRALALAGDDPGLLFNLAAVARFVGHVEEAERTYDRVIASSPTWWTAYRNRSELRRQSASDNHVSELRRRLDQGPPWQGEVQLAYALGKELEDLMDYEAAFQAYARGAAVRRAHMRYSVEDDVDTLKTIASVFDAAYCAPAREVSGSPGPIFILGMPRTGSTLLERKLAGHPDVEPLGELQTFGQAVVEGVRRSAASPLAGKTALIDASARVAPEVFGRAYLEAVAPLTGGCSAFTDKLPLNFLYAGLIARALPTARIIHMVRDPLDTCLGAYRTLFDEAYPFSYDLAELGTYYQAYRGLMAHWSEVLGPRIVEVAYERLVADASGEVERLVERLGLRPAASEAQGAGAAPVMTASASQVREAVHGRSVGLARRYEDHLGPLLAALGPLAQPA